MQFQVEQPELLRALNAIVNVVEKRQTMPILSHLLLQAGPKTLTLTGTDLELELSTQIAIQDATEGKCTVSAKKLFDICRGLPPKNQLQFTLNDKQITIQSDRSRFTLATLSPDDFPTLETITQGKHLAIPKSRLKKLMERTHFAMARQDVRYYLNGLLLVVNSDGLRTVATDGHRLALSDAKLSSGMDEEMEVIIPRKAVNELRRLLDDEDEEIQMVFTSNHLQISLDKLRFTTKLIDGRFPDYKRVIPGVGNKRLRGNRDIIYRALSRTAILSNEKFRGVRLTLEHNKLTLQAQNPEHEQAVEELDVDYEGGSLEIGFNVTYLLDALLVMSSEDFTLELSNADSSGLLTENGDTTSQYVVMPMRL